MIRRDAGDHWLLISQVEHAYLAADLATAWAVGTSAPLPRPEFLIPAIRDHDEGWRIWEQTPRVDEQGRPRAFLEMPMTEATGIWSYSIDFAHRRQREAAAALSHFQQFLATRGKKLTEDRAAIAVAALSMRDAFDAERLLDRLSADSEVRPLSRTTIYRTLDWLEGANLLARDPQVRKRNVYLADRRVGPSALAGLWVSRHFTYLGEKARAARTGPDAETAALDEFLETQRALQSEWLADAASECGSESPEAAAETGFRWVQFFDRLSLWLCGTPTGTTAPLERPDGETIHFTPLPSGEIAVQPYPFRTDELSASVTARLVRVDDYDEAGFQTAYRAAPLEHLRWTLVRW